MSVHVCIQNAYNAWSVVDLHVCIQNTYNVWSVTDLHTVYIIQNT